MKFYFFSLLLLAIELLIPTSVAWGASPVTWSVKEIAKSNSELSLLTDEQGHGVYRVNVSKLRRILNTLERVELVAGTKSQLWLVYPSSNEPNAFAYFKENAGQIVITTGLLDVVGDDMDAFAFVFAHELGHLVKGHGAQKMYLAKLMKFSRELNRSAFIGRQGREIPAAAELSDAMYSAAFSRDQERQADSLGLEFITNAGYDAKGSLRTIRAINSLPKSESATFFRSHPTDGERLSYLNSSIKNSTMYASVGTSGMRHMDIQRESNSSVLYPDDFEYARIAEAMGVIQQEFVVPIEDKSLISGCLDQLSFGQKRTPNANSEIPLKNILDGIELAKAIKPELTTHALINACLDGMLGATDRFSYRTDASEIQDLKKQVNAGLAGIGVELKMQDDSPVTVSVFDGGSAESAGVEVGDLLIRINEMPTKGTDLRQVIRLLRGPAESSVKITLNREGQKQPIELNLTRSILNVKSVTSRVLSSGYGYIKIKSFDYAALDATLDALVSFQSEIGKGLRGIVIDIRDNSGGILQSCVGVSAVFLNQDQLVTKIVTRHEENSERYVASSSIFIPTVGRTYFTRVPNTVKDLPLVVLVNSNTSSGAEIVAAALQDHKRALVIGGRTAGLGTVAKILPLKAGDMLKLTQGLIQRPSGENIADVGVIPDFTVSANKQKSGKDAVLEEAIAINTSVRDAQSIIPPDSAPAVLRR